MSFNRPAVVPGEYEVSHLTDVVHLNTVEHRQPIGGVQLGASLGGGVGDSSSHSASLSGQTTTAFAFGNLFLTNYALTFAPSEPLPGGHDGPATQALVHIPVGAVWRLEYSKYKHSHSGPGGTTGARAHDHEREGGGDYSSFSSSASGPEAAEVGLKDIAFQLTLHCRDARVLSFGILRKASAANSSIITGSVGSSSTSGIASALASLEDRQAYAADFMRSLKKYSFPKDTKKVFAFTYMGGGHGHGAARAQLDGWAIYDVAREFARMGVGAHPADPTRGISLVHPRRKMRWRLDTTSNAKFEFSPTYPPAFWVPVDLTERELGKVKSFRSKGRLPALVYNYSDMLDYAGLGLHAQLYPDTVILRSAQPNVGWTFGRCAADERLLELAEVRVIIDARPYANAVANQAKGGGYENTENYKDTKIEFMCIENIHVMRDALTKMLDTLRSNATHPYNTGAAGQTGDDFWGAMQTSGWLKHVRILLEGAIVCANYIRQGISILIHCSDGWDRTSQLTSLAQIMLDPYYRTRMGFATLVEREWVTFGHQFAKRCGHGEKDTHHADERSPIFVQFLDAIYQIMEQFPFSFEFNADYLTAVADHLYSNKFGTFLGDNERWRSVERVRETTQSVWSEVNAESRRRQFKNPLFGKGGVAQPGAWAGPHMNLSLLSGAELGKAAFLHVSADPRQIGIWPYWHRWERRRMPHAHAQATIGENGAPALAPAAAAVGLHPTPLAQVMTHARLTLAGEKTKASLREAVMLDALAALEQDVARMDAMLKAQAPDVNTARASRGEAPIQLPPTFRTSAAWTPDLLAPPASAAPAASSNSHLSPPPPRMPPPIPSSHAPHMLSTPAALAMRSLSNSISGSGPGSGGAGSGSTSHHPTGLDDDDDDDDDDMGPVPVDDAWSGNPMVLSHGSRDSFIANPLAMMQFANMGLAGGGQGPDEDDAEGFDLCDDLSANAVDSRKRSIIIQRGPGAAPATPKKWPPPPPASSTRHRCLYAFSPIDAGQVSMTKGELVEVTEKGTQGWWRVRNQKGEVGLAPSNRIEQIAQADQPTDNTSADGIIVSPTSETVPLAPALPVSLSLPSRAAAVAASPLDSSSTESPATDASATIVSPAIAVAIGPSAVPQFRMNVAAFGGIKLKSTGTVKRASMLKRAELAAQQQASPADSPPLIDQSPTPASARPADSSEEEEEEVLVESLPVPVAVSPSPPVRLGFATATASDDSETAVVVSSPES